MSEEAQIRSESTWLYPELEPGRWYPVAWREGVFLLLRTGRRATRLVPETHCRTRVQTLPDITWIRAVRPPDAKKGKDP